MKLPFILLLTNPFFMVGCSPSEKPILDSPGKPNDVQASHAYVRPSEVTLKAQAVRSENGSVLISGVTNLPDGLKLWIEIESGHLPLGAPRVVASDENVVVRNGSFTSSPLWLEIPNTRFTKAGWPGKVNVETRERPFAQGPIKVHFESYFNEVWQTEEVLALLGSDEGKKLKGEVLKATDPDVADSPKILDYRQTLLLPRISSETSAIFLVKAAMLTVPGEGRSAGDVQATVDLFVSAGGMQPGKGWTAKGLTPKDFQVSYDFMDGVEGREQALWTANLATGEVKYVNKVAKDLSWSPKD